MADKEEREDASLSDEIVVTKYKAAAEAVNKSLKKLIEKCTVGESVLGLCDFGDNALVEETRRVYRRDKEAKKGVAFPTCISVNHCICHFSPLKSEPDYVLKDGDMVKIDMGAHVDGFIAVVAHTLVIGATKENKVTGRKADVINAAHLACEAAFKIVKPDNENNAITDAVQKIAESYKCKPIEGMLSHQLKQFKIDGEKTIIQNPTEAQRKDHEKCQFEVNDVYAIDILISTGEGRGREMDTRTTVYKKTDETYQLKMKASRAFFSEADKKFGSMPFTLRKLDDEKKAKMGVLECVNHKLVEPFNVLYEKEGEFVAQFKFTVLLMRNGPSRITGLLFDADLFESEHSIEDASIRKLLCLPSKKKDQGTKKKKKRSERSESDKSNINNDTAAAQNNEAVVAPAEAALAAEEQKAPEPVVKSED